MGTPRRVICSQVAVTCASALRGLTPATLDSVCWDWTIGWFPVDQNGTIVQVDGTHVDQVVLGAPHDVGSWADKTLEYPTGAPVGSYRTVDGSPGSGMLRAIVLAPSAADIPLTSQAYVNESVGLFGSGLATLAVGGLIAMVARRRQRPPIRADRNGAVRI